MNRRNFLTNLLGVTGLALFKSQLPKPESTPEPGMKAEGYLVHNPDVTAMVRHKWNGAGDRWESHDGGQTWTKIESHVPHITTDGSLNSFSD
jgi:hypothetical protein